MQAVQRILGILLTLFSLTLLPPIFIAWWSQDSSFIGFLIAFALILITGFLLWLPVRNLRRELKLRDGFIVVVLFWTGLGSIGAIPFVLAEIPKMTLTDAIFESISGLTTTGATVIQGLDTLPSSILFYRQELQWLGGMGIIVLALAILPMLGIGGMQLYRAETPGPMKNAKLTPRITETAKALWYIYLSLTVICCLLYQLAGMSFFDAISHSLSTVSTGGFSTHDLSIGYFDSPLINAIAIIFMLISSINYTLHFLAWRGTSLSPYWRNTECKIFMLMLLGVCCLCCAYLLLQNNHQDPTKLLADAIFQAISITTTTGFTTAEYQNWPTFLPVLLLFMSFVGACASSTGGGLKLMRVLILCKQGLCEIKRLVHPNGVFIVKLDNRPVEERIINSIWGFFAAYIIVFVIILLLLMATGLDQVTAFSAVAACLNNLGPGLGEVSANYASINDPAKWLLCLAMLMGRLEIFTLLILFTPAFWHK